MQCFPERYSNASKVEYFNQLIRLGMLECDALKAKHEGKETSQEDQLIKNIERYMRANVMPSNFNPEDEDNCLIEMDKAFQSLCTSMEEMGVSSPSKLSVFEFETRVSYLMRKNARLEKNT